MKPSLLAALFLACTLPALPAFSQAAGDESWKKTSVQQDPSGTVNGSRMTESFSKKGNRTTDKKSLQTIGSDGTYVPYSDTETETVQVNATTVRTVQRSYARDVNGNRSLVQVTEEQRRSSPNGSQEISRTTSNPDLNGRLQVVQKEIRQVKKSSPTVQESTTTILMPDVNGNLSPSMKVQQRDTKTGEHSTQFRKSTLLPDGNGNWQTAEVREGVTTDGTQGSKTEEQVLQPGSDGKLAVVQKTVTKQSSAANESKSTTETYSRDVPGMAESTGLQLVKRAKTISRKDVSGRQNTEQKVETPSAGNPSDGLRVSQQVIDIVRPAGASGTQEQVMTLSHDANGNMNVVQVSTGSQSRSKQAQADIKPAAKPKK